MKHIAIYPGTFDPITYGHIDITARIAAQYEEVIFAIAEDNYKKTLFTIAERVELANKTLVAYSNVKVASFDGLLVDFCQAKGAHIIVRGLRATSDFEREFQMALMNKTVAPHIETIFLMAQAKHQFVSSSIVKNFASLGGSMQGLVPPIVEQAMNEKYKP